jgi:hypothetical protein
MYAYFAVAALVLAIAAILLATRWRHMPTRLHGSMGIVLLALITAPTLHAAPQEESLAAYRQALAHQSAGKTEECADELSKALLDEDPHMQAAVLHRLGNLKTEETFTKLRELYAETSPGQPAQPSVEQLEDIVKKLEESSSYYQDALSAQPDCAPAQTNLQRVRQLIEDIKKEIERLKQQQQQDNQQKQDEQQQQQDDQQKQDQQQQHNDHHGCCPSWNCFKKPHQYGKKEDRKRSLLNDGHAINPVLYWKTPHNKTCCNSKQKTDNSGHRLVVSPMRFFPVVVLLYKIIPGENLKHNSLFN